MPPIRIYTYTFEVILEGMVIEVVVLASKINQARNNAKDVIISSGVASEDRIVNINLKEIDASLEF